MSSETRPESLVHRYYSPARVVQGLWKGKSLYRTLVNLSLGGIQVSGRILDIGSKSAQASYFRFLRISADSVITCSDLSPSDGVVGIDVEKRFPLGDGTFDVVLAINLFEHIRIFEVAPAEIHRVLSRNGRAVVVVPFLHEVHPDPGDYFRYTDMCLEKVWRAAGFECLSMEAVGEGVLGFALTKYISQVVPGWLYGPLAALAYLGCTVLDRIASVRPRVHQRTIPERFPLGYVLTLQKIA